METILIDEEQTELELLQKKITQLSSVKVLGAFTDPHEGLIEVSRKQPDILFLDICIPEVNWMKVAKQLKKAIPDMQIVFLATLDKYALEAFDIQADDYLLKPVDYSRLKQAMVKVTSKLSQQKSAPRQMVGCFQSLHFRYEESNQDIVDIHWRTSKAREIFSYLVHKRGKLVRKDVLVDLFWSDMPVKEAYNQLYSTIYQIRKTIKSINYNIQIVNREDSYRLLLNDCLVDVDMWERGIETNPVITSENIESHKNWLLLYRGDYFEAENYMWALNERERLSIKWEYQMKRLVHYYLTNELYAEAILLYLRYQKINPFISESYFELMKLYDLFNDRYAVEEQYQLLKEMCEEELGTEPDVEIVVWYESWRK